jgi:hypothetical protein
VPPDNASNAVGLAPPKLVALSALTAAKLRNNETLPFVCPTKTVPTPLLPPLEVVPKNRAPATDSSPCGLPASGELVNERNAEKFIPSRLMKNAVPAPCTPPLRVVPTKTPPDSARPTAGFAPSRLRPLLSGLNRCNAFPSGPVKVFVRMISTGRVPAFRFDTVNEVPEVPNTNLSISSPFSRAPI